ncbi:hypothetical protein M2413_001198 [Pseudomonas putida]|nr:hypothetical protein [Pseudomonas putida]
MNDFTREDPFTEAPAHMVDQVVVMTDQGGEQ